MKRREMAVLPLTSTGIILIRRRDSSDNWTISIPSMDMPGSNPAYAQKILRDLLGVSVDIEELGEGTSEESVLLFRARIPGKIQPRAQGDGDAIVMDFASFEAAIASGRISDMATSTAWLRHRLLEGETTRRKRLPRTIQWTPEVTETMVSMWKNGRTSGEIAREIGMTRNAVMGRINRMGLSGQGGCDVPKGAAQDSQMRKEILNEFKTVFERDPVPNRGGDDALLVSLAAMRAERNPNRTARWSGVPLDRVMDILMRYHDRGIWPADDESPTRWTGPGRELNMLVDAQLVYGVFKNQKN